MRSDQGRIIRLAGLIAPEPGVTITYRALRATCRALGEFFDQRGVAPGEVVSFMLRNGVSAATLFLGTMYAGRVVDTSAYDYMMRYFYARISHKF